MSVNNNKLTFIIIRFFDLTITLIGLVILSPILFFLTICCYIDTVSAFFLQQRLGKDEEVFILIKFRWKSNSVAKNSANHCAVFRQNSNWKRFLNLIISK